MVCEDKIELAVIASLDGQRSAKSHGWLFIGDFFLYQIICFASPLFVTVFKWESTQLAYVIYRRTRLESGEASERRIHWKQK